MWAVNQREKRALTIKTALPKAYASRETKPKIYVLKIRIQNLPIKNGILL
jgi:hypothetical protein